MMPTTQMVILKPLLKPLKMHAEFTEVKIVELLMAMDANSTWSLPIEDGTLEVYYDGTDWAVERVSDEYDESYMYESPLIAAKEILYYYENN